MSAVRSQNACDDYASGLYHILHNFVDYVPLVYKDDDGHSKVLQFIWVFPGG